MKDFASFIDTYRWTGEKLAGKQSHGSYPIGIISSGMSELAHSSDAAPSLSMTSPSSSLILSYEDVDDHVNVDGHDQHAQSRCQYVPRSPDCKSSGPIFLPSKGARTSALTPTRQLIFSEIMTDQSRDTKKIKKSRKQYVVKHKDYEESKKGPMESQKSSIAGSGTRMESCELLPNIVTMKSNTSQKKHGNVSGEHPRKKKSKTHSKGLHDNVLEEQPNSSKIKRQRRSLGNINDHMGSHGAQNSRNGTCLGHGNIDNVESSPKCEIEAPDPCMKVMRRKSKRIKTSAYFKETVKPLGQRDIVNKAWVPPVSVHALIQEELYQDPWKVLVACMLLNKTSGTQMRRVIWDLFALCPTPEAAVAMETEEIEEVIRPLGLQKKRALMIQKFSREYLGNHWSNVGELHGIGKYATDAYAIFCEGRWREVKPEDHKLVDYWRYLHDTDGLGNAFKDDRQLARC